ncbi:transposable element Tcb1 transposase [Trichonephila clavipes]|nr:transposable element Tcb1 transposase [Trichonephila clavipes]
MSRRKQISAFDQVSEFDRWMIVGYRDCGLSFSEIGSRVGRNQTTNHRRLHRQCWDERRMWVAEWNEVVFTDESRICLQHHDDRF